MPIEGEAPARFIPHCFNITICGSRWPASRLHCRLSSNQSTPSVTSGSDDLCSYLGFWPPFCSVRNNSTVHVCQNANEGIDCPHGTRRAPFNHRTPSPTPSLTSSAVSPRLFIST
uniref:Uncharacterized protein n=1 Tax=Leersia perrieri TaxID=77586 RepID=A0A0D9XKG3_9ORYZ